MNIKQKEETIKGKFQVISHPLIQIINFQSTPSGGYSTKDFRELVNEIAMLMKYRVISL